VPEASNDLMGQRPSKQRQVYRWNLATFDLFGSDSYLHRGAWGSPMSWIPEFTPSKPRTVLFISGGDPNAKKPVVDLMDETGFECVRGQVSVYNDL
jgi:hypothetical protein